MSEPTPVTACCCPPAPGVEIRDCPGGFEIVKSKPGDGCSAPMLYPQADKLADMIFELSRWCDKGGVQERDAALIPMLIEALHSRAIPLARGVRAMEMRFEGERKNMAALRQVLPEHAARKAEEKWAAEIFRVFGLSPDAIMISGLSPMGKAIKTLQWYFKLYATKMVEADPEQAPHLPGPSEPIPVTPERVALLVSILKAYRVQIDTGWKAAEKKLRRAKSDTARYKRFAEHLGKERLKASTALKDAKARIKELEAELSAQETSQCPSPPSSRQSATPGTSRTRTSSPGITS